MSISPSQPKLALTSASTFWRRSEIKETDSTLWDLADLKEQAGDKVEIGAVTYSEPFKRKTARLLTSSAPSAIGLALAGGALGLGLAAAGTLTLPAALLMAVGAPMGVLGPAGAEVAQDLKADKERPVGLSVQVTGPEEQFRNLRDDSTPSEAVRETVLMNMKRYPAARQVLHLNGHGQGSKAVAGLAGEKVQGALQEAVQKSGRPIDIAFYESCYNSNFEALHAQANSAAYAVAFEDQAPKSNAKGGRVPLDEMMSAASQAESHREAAIQMAKIAGEHFERGESASIGGVPWNERNLKKNLKALWENTDSTVSAIDLKTLKSELSPALNTVGKALNAAYDQDSSLKAKLRSARDKNKLERSGDLIDMGGFFEDLKKSAPEHTSTIDKALSALNKATLYTRTGQERPMSGLSFHVKPKRKLGSNPMSNAFADPTLPQGWVEFIQNVF